MAINKNKQVLLKKLGLISYEKGLATQLEIFEQIVNTKIANRALDVANQVKTANYLLTCEHSHVFTLGKSGKQENLLDSAEVLKKDKIDFYHIGRGGDITYHGPGQMVIYPILDLDNFFTDIHLYLRKLEESVIRTLHFFGIEAGRIEGLTGVWVDYKTQENPRKICAFGVKMSRWVTMHGLALNVNTDLNYFTRIVPCGITNKAVTSIQQELGKIINLAEVEDVFVKEFSKLFEAEIHYN